MIEEIVGNLLETDRCHVIVHQCNLMHTFGGGIAKAIAEKFPEAFEADRKTVYNDPNKLGTYSAAKSTDAKGTLIQFVVNLYCQVGLGGGRQTSYDYMVNALTKLKESLEAKHKEGKEYVVGIPYKMGAGLANGDFRIVKAIIESVFGASPIKVIIYYLPEFAHLINET